MRTLRLAMAQINATVGDLDGNTAKVLEFMGRARELGADLVAFPELAIPGYPPEDLLFKPDFVQRNIQCMRQVVEASAGLTVVVGFADADGDIFNAAAVGHDGKLVGIYHKMYLPNYGVFDEDRYFRAGRECPVFVINGVSVGVNVCEDIWYPVGPTEVQQSAGAEVIVNISASPYNAGKRHFRKQMLATRASDNSVYVSYTNMVGGQDELVFDGGSMLLDPQGGLMSAGHQFEEDLVVADLDVEGVLRSRLHDSLLRKEHRDLLKDIGTPQLVQVSGPSQERPRPPLPERQPRLYEGPAEVYWALITGVRDYVRKNGFAKVAIGLSGGIDSSLTAILAADALGKENVLGVAMPSRFSSEGSLLDARALADNLGIELWTIPIEEAYTAYLHLLETSFSGTQPGTAEENVQARIRGNLLMAISNKFGWLVLATGNKSEMATGYTTLYGDLAGGFAVIKDVPKTLVYQLAHYRNTLGQHPAIPQSIIEKEPSAELRPDQRDVDSLPPYSELDSILQAYVEEERSYTDIVAMGHSAATVQRVITLVDRSEYKRRQAPPGVKITPRAFGRDRRLPIVNHYRQF